MWHKHFQTVVTSIYNLYLECELETGNSNAGTPLARISHRELIDKLYDFLTAFLQLCYELSVMSMRSLWGLWEVYEAHRQIRSKRPRRNILTCRDVARWSRSPTDLSMRSMSLIDKSVPVEYRYSFVTALLQQLFLSTNHIAPIK